MSRLAQEKIQYIKEHPNLTNKELSQILQCGTHTVGKYKKQFGTSFSQTHDFSKWNQYIIDNYYKKTSTSLAKEIGCSKSYIIKIWMENCNKDKDVRKYYSNFDYFKKIDSHNKAYILGFICADGCVYKREKHQGLLSITVQNRDKLILEKIKTELESNNPISSTDNASTLVIVSQKIFDDLGNLGIHPRKTYQLNLNEVIANINPIFLNSFICGYFDGDGSITLKEKPSQSHISFAIPKYNSIQFINLLKRIGVEAHFHQDNRTLKYNIEFGNLGIYGSTNKYIFLQQIYKDVTIYIERKHILALKLIQQIQENKTNRNENKIAVEKWGELLGTLRRQSAAEP